MIEEILKYAFTFMLVGVIMYYTVFLIIGSITDIILFTIALIKRIKAK